MDSLVPMKRLQEVMSELDVALDREKQAQSLLADQSSQLKEVTRRLESESSDRNHSEQSVKFAIKVRRVIYKLGYDYYTILRSDSLNDE